jgi:hypothetical protein
MPNIVYLFDLFIETPQPEVEVAYHIETGKQLGVGTLGVTVNFATAFGGTLDSEGDYVGQAWGIAADDSTNVVLCRCTQFKGSMTIYPAYTNTIVRWFAIGRTQ